MLLRLPESDMGDFRYGTRQLYLGTLRAERETSVEAASAGTGSRSCGCTYAWYSCLARAITSGEHGPSELLVHSLLPTMDSSYLFMEITVHCLMDLGCTLLYELVHVQQWMHGTSIGPYMPPGLHLLHIQAPKSCTPHLSVTR